MTLFKDTYVMYQLLDFVDESSIITLCKASKKLNEIYKNYIKIEDDKRFDVNIDFFEDYCKDNHIIRLWKLIKILEKIKALDCVRWKNGLSNACRHGHIDIVKLIIEKGVDADADCALGLFYACEGGHIDIVKLMIEKGADDWNWGLEGACQCGNIDIIKLLIEKGANPDYGFYSACYGGNIDIVKFLIEKGTNNWNWGLDGACYGNNIDIIKLMIEKGATNCYCQKSIEKHLS